VVIAAPSVSISQGSHAGTAGVKALGLESFGSSRESHGRCHEKNSNQEVSVELDGIIRRVLRHYKDVGEGPHLRSQSHVTLCPMEATESHVLGCMGERKAISST
jgi:hypothetical protein